MEDLSSLIWLGVVIIWFVTRFIRRAARKAARKQETRPRPTVSRPAATPTDTHGFPSQGSGGLPSQSRPGFTGRGDQGPPPIVPR